MTKLLLISAGLLLASCAAVTPAPPPSASTDAPAFALTDQFQHTWTPADSQTKPLLMDLWATWCAPCLQALPDLQQFNEKHQQKVALIGAAMDTQGHAVVDPVVKRYGVTYAVALGSPALSRALDAGSYPTLVLMVQGKVAKRLVGRQSLADLERELAPWL